MTHAEIIAFENKVVAMARILHPGVSCFTQKHLDPIRQNIREAEAKMKAPVDDAVVTEIPKVEVKEEPKAEPIAPKVAKKKGRPKKKR